MMVWYASLELSHRILPTGEPVAVTGGELDIATADAAVRYVAQVIDPHHGPVVVDLTVASPSPWLVKLLRITALDRKLLGATGPRVVFTRPRPAIEAHR
jgi:hypothetical protein